MQIIPCHKKMHFHEEYVLQRWDPRQQQMLLGQKQVYTPDHAVAIKSKLAYSIHNLKVLKSSKQTMLIVKEYDLK